MLFLVRVQRVDSVSNPLRSTPHMVLVESSAESGRLRESARALGVPLDTQYTPHMLLTCMPLECNHNTHAPSLNQTTPAVRCASPLPNRPRRAWNKGLASRCQLWLVAHHAPRRPLARCTHAVRQQPARGGACPRRLSGRSDEPCARVEQSGHQPFAGACTRAGGTAAAQKGGSRGSNAAQPLT
eukprot:3454149-Prymnesium_polylepis.1